MIKSIYEYLDEILPSIDQPIVFELGLSIGMDTIKIVDLCNENLQFHGFEPNPVCIDYLKKNGIDKLITLVEAAVGKEEGKTILYQFTDKKDKTDLLSTGPTSIYKPVSDDILPWLDCQDHLEVDVISLDTYCKQSKIDHIDFIWADIQSGEYNMILGAQEILKSTKYLYMEHLGSKIYEGQKTLEEMAAALPGNWEMVQKYPGDAFLKNTEI